ncbi:MAG: hypothetical protein V3U08_05000 [Nitrospirales bacterium]
MRKVFQPRSELSGTLLSHIRLVPFQLFSQNQRKWLTPRTTNPLYASPSVKELERIAVNYAANAVLKDDPDCSAQDLSMLAEWETSSQGFVLRWHFAAAQPGRAWFLPRS